LDYFGKDFMSGELFELVIKRNGGNLDEVIPLSPENFIHEEEGEVRNIPIRGWCPQDEEGLDVEQFLVPEDKRDSFDPFK
jgi:hypothetical protein